MMDGRVMVVKNQTALTTVTTKVTVMCPWQDLGVPVVMKVGWESHVILYVMASRNQWTVGTVSVTVNVPRVIHVISSVMALVHVIMRHVFVKVVTGVIHVMPISVWE